MVPVAKKNEKVRICVDLKYLNKAVKREKFMLPTLEDVAIKLTVAKLLMHHRDSGKYHWTTVVRCLQHSSLKRQILFPETFFWDHIGS